ncbi:MAG: alpha/beta hydrolase, partial [Anaerolineae bacterium]|nr:alpha/beta hydrolase [Anaerolineae bacterium]
VNAIRGLIPDAATHGFAAGGAALRFAPAGSPIALELGRPGPGIGLGIDLTGIDLGPVTLTGELSIGVNDSGAPAVVLVHGLWAGPWMLGALRARLRAEGYAVHAFRYASVRAPLESTARAFARFLDGLHAEPIHIVAHSLGGVVAHEGLLLQPCKGNVVLLGTPWRGSRAARQLEQLPLGATLRGHCLGDWLANPCPHWRAANPLGVIAGSRGMGMGRL